ncbi:MAG: GNAT family N-acetyltransferase [Lysobacterales bacterium]
MGVFDLTLETDRLLLRPPNAGDFDRYAEMLADPEAARYIGGVAPRAVAWRKFLALPGAWVIQGFAMFSVIERASGEWVGQCGPWRPEGWPGNEIGWALRRPFWGRGYAFEAAQAALDFAFERLAWSEVIHCIHPDNLASQRLAERLGSAPLGPVRLPEPYSESPSLHWGQSRQQWRQRTRPNLA